MRGKHSFKCFSYHSLFMLWWGGKLVAATWNSQIGEFPALTVGISYLPVPSTPGGARTAYPRSSARALKALRLRPCVCSQSDRTRAAWRSSTPCTFRPSRPCIHIAQKLRMPYVSVRKTLEKNYCTKKTQKL